MILKSFDFQCDFDFQITTSKMILILNQFYLDDLILILKSSTYDDFAHLWAQRILKYAHLAPKSCFPGPQCWTEVKDALVPLHFEAQGWDW